VLVASEIASSREEGIRILAPDGLWREGELLRWHKGLRWLSFD
jgi:hypothetical protein